MFLNLMIQCFHKCYTDIVQLYHILLQKRHSVLLDGQFDDDEIIMATVL